ncbi:unnamed protein product [Paramecium primaurelia]|uniref:Transmembrane protein n=1 Tax=Paramecium primaurelia TaxID=5886 RepID=A0A8S1NYM5_PARPR|nr:unnamed protein product [Paramecium primaurelia]
MLQVYLVRYDCLKIQQLIPSRIFCVIFYTICIIDLLLLLFSCSFFIIPYQQQEFEQQYIIEKETSDWELDLNQQDFKKFNIEGQLNQEKFRFNQVHQDPYLLLNYTTLFQKTGFHEYFGYINYQIAKLTNSKNICLQLIQYNQKFKSQMIQKLPQCNNSFGVPIIPWFWKGESIQYLVEICLKVSIEDNQLQYQGGCYKNGFIYKELEEDNLQTFENLSIYIRHVNDPYISGVEYSHNYSKPKQDNHNQFPKFIYYCFLFGCAGIIYIIFIYLILTLKRNSEKTQFV